MPFTTQEETKKSEGHRISPEALSQTFSELKQTRRHSYLVYYVFIGLHTHSDSQPYYENVRLLHALVPRSSAYTRPEWNDEGQLAHAFAHEVSCDELKHQAAGSRWAFGDPKLIVAYLREHIEKTNRSPASTRQAWENSTARHFSYVRLKQSLRLLGLVDPCEQRQILDWLREQNQLEWSQMLYYPWELCHLELVMKRWKEGAEGRGWWHAKQHARLGTEASPAERRGADR